MYTVLRFFLIDSMAIKNIENLGNQHEQLPDVMEVLQMCIRDSCLYN